MDIFKILQEAKNPNSTDSEDKEQKTPIDDTTESDDNNQDDSDIPENDNDESSDDETVDEIESTDTDDDSSDDYTEDTEEVAPDDTSESEDADPDADTSTEQPEGENGEGEQSSNNEDKQKELALLNSSINLYFNIKNNIVKLDSMSNIDIVANKIVIQVKKNFTIMVERLYEYITRSFNMNSYVKNLYTYNYFIEAYKINVEMLKKISVFTLNT